MNFGMPRTAPTMDGPIKVNTPVGRSRDYAGAWDRGQPESPVGLLG